MQRTIGLAAAALVAAAAAPAQADSTYTGLEIGNFEHEIFVEGGGVNLVARDDVDYVGLKLGRVTRDWRAYATLHLPDTETDSTVWWLTGSYDYLFMPGQPLQPFVGGHVGYYRFDADNSGLEISSWTLGPEAGVQFMVEPLLVEVGYRFGFGLSTSDNRGGVDYDVDEAEALYVGVNVTF